MKVWVFSKYSFGRGIRMFVKLFILMVWFYWCRIFGFYVLLVLCFVKWKINYWIVICFVMLIMFFVKKLYVNLIYGGVIILEVILWFISLFVIIVSKYFFFDWFRLFGCGYYCLMCFFVYDCYIRIRYWK